MALKTIRVRIKSVDDALDDAVGVMRAILAKKKVRKQHGQYFESLEAVRAALTETRLALLRLIRERKPKSVPEPIDPDEKSIPQGDCFEAAAKFIQQAAVVDWPDDYRLVHGNVATLRQDDAVNRAWVEEKNIVHEVSSGRNLMFSRDDYYERHKITNIRTYTVLQALELALEHGHCGPWD
jgi:hypothetical protein